MGPNSRRRVSPTRRRSPGFYWSEQLGTAGTLIVLTTLGGLGGAALYGVVPPEAGRRRPGPIAAPD